jgi:O-acetyl-ADP-ribose deacetylase (regulator of RNase III)
LEVAKSIPARLGEVVVTGAGSLRAKYVFHAVTIGKSKGNAAEIVAKVTRRSLQLLRELGQLSIAFPAIGAGVAGFALEDVAANMAEVIVDDLRTTSAPLFGPSIYSIDLAHATDRLY